jgi:hypothetical protein
MDQIDKDRKDSGIDWGERKSSLQFLYGREC